MALFQTENLRVDVQAGGIAELWLDEPGRTHNVLSRQVIADLDRALDRIAAEAALQLLIIRSSKATGFIAGADLHELAAIRSPHEATALSAAGQQLFAKLADLRIPSIAILKGACLGGGLELALACDYRLVFDQPSAELGLPEVTLGLLPAWGGTQRLPRVVGLENALQMILGGRRLKATQARRWGLAEGIASTEAELAVELERLSTRARRDGKRTRIGLPLRTWRQRFLESTPLGRSLVCRGTERLLRKRVPDDMPAPWEALRVIQTGLSQGMNPGLQAEREAVSRLAQTTACRNLVNLFFQQEKARKLPAGPEAQAAQLVRRVGIVGAGTMGAGIAQLAAIRGFQVAVQEANPQALAAGMQKIDALFQKAVENRVLSAEDARAKLAAIGQTTTWEGFADADLVVEAVIEDLEAKQAVFRQLEEHARPDAVLATNTSSLLVQRLQVGRQHPERVGGLHFFNPVHKMPLVEVVQASATTEPTAATLAQWAIALGKTPVVVKDSPGFLVNRILFPYFYDAVCQLQQGESATAIDRAMRKFGMPMGPLELLDQIGLDVAAHICTTLQPSLSTRFPETQVFEQMHRAGFIGQKAGKGFYTYGRKRPLENQAVRAMLGFPGVRSRVGAEEIRDRLVMLMVNEAAACLGGGIAVNAETIDLAMVFGTGWAPHRGGPLRYADDFGIDKTVQQLELFQQRFGAHFEPCAELRRRAQAGARLYPALASGPKP
jgi:3-hydroxyacyl-CoA dehydrogenase/enoyl-CoA hydratase/3-hydroxybutyryl-CoA epimerase